MIYGRRLTEVIQKRKLVPYRLTTPYNYEVGSTYWCGYWQKYYTVVEVNGRQVKVHWEDGSETLHSTSLNPVLDYRLKEMEFTSDTIPEDSMMFAEIKARLSICKNFSEEIIDDFEDRYMMIKKCCPQDATYYYLCLDDNKQKLFLNRDLVKSPRLPR